MSACYSVYFYLNFKNKNKCENILHDYLYEIFKKDLKTLSSQMKFILKKDCKYSSNYEESTKKEGEYYSGDFEAPYSYESIFYDLITAMMPYLNNGSYVGVCPDNESYTYLIKNNTVTCIKNR